MALSRLGNRTRAGDFTWPGFVDALASLLMVFVFVLMVFVLIQANLAYRLSGQDESLIILREELAMLGDCLLYTSPSPRDVRSSRMPSSA